MSEFTTSTTYTVNCPDCKSDAVKKHGFQSGEQRYFCKVCKKAFRSNGKAEGRKMDAEMVGSAIRDFYTGKSYKQIAEGLREEYDLPNEPSKATVYEWVRDYTSEGLRQMKGHQAKTGGDWVADEMQVDVGGKKMWLWNVMDAETRYILATHLTPRRDAQAARVVFRKAMLAADKPPRTITTDKLRSYIRPIKEIMPEARHVQSEGLAANINNNLSERLQGTFRDRTKTLRGLDSRKTGQHYLDGWTLNYNHFRGHHSLRNQTPGHRGKVNPPFREWADVVKAGAAPPKPTLKAEARPDSQPKPKSPQRAASPQGLPQIYLPRKRIGPRVNAPRKRPRKLHPMAELRADLQRAQRRRPSPRPPRGLNPPRLPGQRRKGKH